MKYCEKCRVSVPGDLHTCPLCQGDLSGLGEAGRTAFPVLPASQSLHKGLLRLIGLGTIAAAAVCIAVNLSLPQSGWWSVFVVAGVISFWLTFWMVVKKRGNIPKAILWQVGLHFRAGPALGLVDRRALELVSRFCHTASAYRRNDRHGSHRPGDAAENPGLYPISDAGRRIRLYPVCPFAVRLPSSCLPLGGMRRGKHYFTGCAVPV